MFHPKITGGVMAALVAASAVAVAEIKKPEDLIGFYDEDGGRCNDVLWEITKRGFEMRVKNNTVLNNRRVMAQVRAHPLFMQLLEGKLSKHRDGFVMRGIKMTGPLQFIDLNLYITPKERNGISLAVDGPKTAMRRIPRPLYRCDAT